MNQDTQNTQPTALTEADRAAIVDALASLVQASAQSAKPAQSSPTQ